MSFKNNDAQASERPGRMVILPLQPAFLALVAAASLALAACGGGGSSASSAGAPGTPAESLAVDSPQLLDAIPDLSNSADTLKTTYALGVHPISQDAISGSASVSDASIVTASVSGDPLTLTVTPQALGTASVTVVVTQGNYKASRSFTYAVNNLSRQITVAVAAPAESAIELSNASPDRTVQIALSNNGFPSFRSRQEIVDYVRAMPEIEPGEPFERKLWRFLVNNVSHWLPTSTALWLDDPLILVNSVGWGLCSHVSGAYVAIAREAGLQARVWALTGHVVPEVFINGRWRMYDPDLAIYYLGRDGEVAGVEDLVADPALISAPVNPIYPGRVNTQMYSQTVADIYGSAADNWVADATVVSTVDSPPGLVVLPPGATLTYPGVWTDAPTGYDGSVPFPITYFKQARLDIPAGWSGTLNLPFVPWDVQGSGTVSFAGGSFDAGSQAVRTALQTAGAPVSNLTVAASQGLSIIFFVNATQYSLQSAQQIGVTGKDVWAIGARAVQLPVANRASGLPQPGQIKPAAL